MRHDRTPLVVYLAGAVAGLAALAWPAGAAAQVTVTVDPTTNVHTISPLIYGMNYVAADQVKTGGVTLSRWGGDSTSRYNYQIDVTNTGNDYYFENIAGCWNTADNYCNPAPPDPQTDSSANAYLAAIASENIDTLFTIPAIGWVSKPPPLYAHPFVCGFPKSFAATQDSFDPYDGNCGDGLHGGKDLTPPAATTTSVAIDPTWATAWVTYLTGRFGPSRGRRIYTLDNEPNLWSSTHRDIRTTRLSYDEEWQRMQQYSLAILQADPTAQISGPAEWGWPNYLCSDADIIANGCSASSPDRAKHGGEELTAWLLDQAYAYDKAHGQRLLHYLDLHYYPQGGSSPQNTRSLWDPTYTDPSWINAQIMLIPRMRAWVEQHYPGTKILISEYDFGNHTSATGAITYAEVLGIFGREGLDAATAWSPPAVGDAAMGAWQLYRNYDGKGSGFESISIQATVSPANSGIQAYAAIGSAGPTRATVALVNEGAAAVNVTVALGSFQGSGAAPGALWYTGDSATLTQQASATVQNNQVTVKLPGTSFGMLVVSGTAPGLPDLGTQQPDLAGDRDDLRMTGSMTGDLRGAPTPGDGGGSDDLRSTTGDGGPTPGGPAPGCGCSVLGARSSDSRTGLASTLMLLVMLGLLAQNSSSASSRRRQSLCQSIRPNLLAFRSPPGLHQPPGPDDN